MTREPDNPATPQADERLDRLVDDAIREVTIQLAPASVKARVMAAWDERQGADGVTDAPARGWWNAPALLRASAALAGTFVIVLGVFLAWQHVTREFDAADRHRASPTATARTQPRAGMPAPQPSEQTAEASPGGQETSEAAQPRRRRSRYVTVEWRADRLADAGPHLPGAPAGEPGDPVSPMAGPPPISIAPIQSASSISEMARPVTEFPADNQPPAGEGADAGKSGGPRR